VCLGPLILLQSASAWLFLAIVLVNAARIVPNNSEKWWGFDLVRCAVGNGIGRMMLGDYKVVLSDGRALPVGENANTTAYMQVKGAMLRVNEHRWIKVGRKQLLSCNTKRWPIPDISHHEPWLTFLFYRLMRRKGMTRI